MGPTHKILSRNSDPSRKAAHHHRHGTTACRQLTNRPGSKQTPGPDGRNSSLDNWNGQTSRPGDITPHYPEPGTAVTRHRKKKSGPQERQLIETFQGNGTEARPPPQGIFILPQAVHKTGTGAPRRQQEVKSEKNRSRETLEARMRTR